MVQQLAHELGLGVQIVRLMRVQRHESKHRSRVEPDEVRRRRVGLRMQQTVALAALLVQLGHDDI